MKSGSKYIFSALILITAAVWLALFAFPDSKFRLIACDVGQGDAILAVYKTTQILVDGGPDNQVLTCLARHMPFWDREIELVVLTHPQKDHYQGLIEVVRRYQVDNFLTNGLDSGSQGYQVLKDEVGGRGIKVIHPNNGMVIRAGLISLEIVHPSEEYMSYEGTKLPSNEVTNPLAVYTSEKDPNNFSIVATLSFGDFEALLTGDIPPEVSDLVSERLALSEAEGVDYLKVPHHGSKNGLTQDLLEKVSPQVAVISAGKDNSYGHPHQETLKILGERDIKILRTDLMGDVVVTTDGKRWWWND